MWTSHAGKGINIKSIETIHNKSYSEHHFLASTPVDVTAS